MGQNSRALTGIVEPTCGSAKSKLGLRPYARHHPRQRSRHRQVDANRTYSEAQPQITGTNFLSSSNGMPTGGLNPVKCMPHGWSIIDISAQAERNAKCGRRQYPIGKTSGVGGGCFMRLRKASVPMSWRTAALQPRRSRLLVGSCRKFGIETSMGQDGDCATSPEAVTGTHLV